MGSSVSGKYYVLDEEGKAGEFYNYVLWLPGPEGIGDLNMSSVAFFLRQFYRKINPALDLEGRYYPPTFIIHDRDPDEEKQNIEEYEDPNPLEDVNSSTLCGSCNLCNFPGSRYGVRSDVVDNKIKEFYPRYNAKKDPFLLVFRKRPSHDIVVPKNKDSCNLVIELNSHLAIDNYKTSLPSEQEIKENLLRCVNEEYTRLMDDQRSSGARVVKKKETRRTDFVIEESGKNDMETEEEIDANAIPVTRLLQFMNLPREHFTMKFVPEFEIIEKGRLDLVDVKYVPKTEVAERNKAQFEKELVKMTKMEKENADILQRATFYRGRKTLFHFVGKQDDLPMIDKNLLNDLLNKNVKDEKKKEKLKSLLEPYTKLDKDWEGKRFRGILLHGPPGTGKTYISVQIIKNLSLMMTNDNHNLSSTRFMSVYQGRTQRNILKEAEKSFKRRWLLHVCFLDECESVLMNRNSKELRQHKIDALNSLLPILSNSNGRYDNLLFFGATNNIKTLDEAAIREERFDVKCFYGCLDVSQKFKEMKDKLPIKWIQDCDDKSSEDEDKKSTFYKRLESVLTKYTVNFTYAQIIRVINDLKNYFFKEYDQLSEHPDEKYRNRDFFESILRGVENSIRKLCIDSYSKNLFYNRVLWKYLPNVRDNEPWRMCFDSTLNTLLIRDLDEIGTGNFILNVDLLNENVYLEQELRRKGEGWETLSARFEFDLPRKVHTPSFANYVFQPLLEKFKVQAVYYVDKWNTFTDLEKEFDEKLQRIGEETDHYSSSLVIFDLDELVGWRNTQKTVSGSVADNKSESTQRSKGMTLNKGRNYSRTLGGSVTLTGSKAHARGGNVTYSQANSFGMTRNINENVQVSHQQSKGISVAQQDSRTTGKTATYSSTNSTSHLNHRSIGTTDTDQSGTADTLGRTAGYQIGWSTNHTNTTGYGRNFQLTETTGRNLSTTTSRQAQRSSTVGGSYTFSETVQKGKTTTDGWTETYTMTFPKIFHSIVTFMKNRQNIDIRKTYFGQKRVEGEIVNQPFFCVITKNGFLALLVKKELAWGGSSVIVTESGSLLKPPPLPRSLLMLPKRKSQEFHLNPRENGTVEILMKNTGKKPIIVRNGSELLLNNISKHFEFVFVALFTRRLIYQCRIIRIDSWREECYKLTTGDIISLLRLNHPKSGLVRLVLNGVPFSSIAEKKNSVYELKKDLALYLANSNIESIVIKAYQITLVNYVNVVNEFNRIAKKNKKSWNLMIWYKGEQKSLLEAQESKIYQLGYELLGEKQVRRFVTSKLTLVQEIERGCKFTLWNIDASKGEKMIIEYANGKKTIGLVLDSSPNGIVEKIASCAVGTTSLVFEKISFPEKDEDDVGSKPKWILKANGKFVCFSKVSEPDVETMVLKDVQEGVFTLW